MRGRYLFGCAFFILLVLLTTACEHDPVADSLNSNVNTTITELPISDAQEHDPPVADSPGPKRDLDVEWRIATELKANFYYGETDSIVFIYSHDGGISGHHMESKLYAVDKHTGQVRWQLDADYRGFSVALAEDQEQATIFTANNREYHLRHIDVTDGEAIWMHHVVVPEDRQMASTMAVYGSSVLTFIDFLEGGDEVRSYDRMSGELQWSRQSEESSRVAPSKPGDPYLLLEKADRLAALDPHTGDEVWEVAWSDEEVGQPFFVWLDHDAEPLHERWIWHEGEGIYLELESGEVKHRYLAEEGAISIYDIDDRYWLINNRLIDVVEQQELWMIPGILTEPMLDGERLFIMIDGVPSAVNWQDGSIVWTLTEEKIKHPLENYAGSFIQLDDRYLAVPYQEELLVLERATGEIAYRTDQFSFDYLISLSDVSRNGLIKKSGDDLYIGSWDGSFSKLSVEELLEAARRSG